MGVSRTRSLADLPTGGRAEEAYASFKLMYRRSSVLFSLGNTVDKLVELSWSNVVTHD